MAAINDGATSNAASQWWTANGGTSNSQAAGKVSFGASTLARDFTLAPGARISGTITGGGAPLAGIRMIARELASKQETFAIATAADGTYTLNIAPGDYNLLASNSTTAAFATQYFGIPMPGLNNANLASKVSLTAGSAFTADMALGIGRRIDGVVSDPTFQFRRLSDLAVILTNQRQPKQAMPVFERAIALADQFSDRRSLGVMYAGLAKAHHLQGDVELAIRNNQRSLQVYEELSALDQVACTLDNIAVQYAEYGNRERARESLARGARIATEIRRDTTLASIRTTEAEITAKAEPAEAMELAQQALKFSRTVDQIDAQIRAMILIGELKMNTNGAAARKSFQEARQLAEERAPYLLRMIFDRWSHAAEAAGDGDEALRLARRALESIKA